MQFIPNGPEIPETLLQAHKEGRVLFFCGAGISYKVGLKDFQWLVDEIYPRCGTKKEPIENVAYSQKRYDLKQVMSFLRPCLSWLTGSCQ
jgi:NAD-dependent SIR2 family protein deacetylase